MEPHLLTKYSMIRIKHYHSFQKSEVQSEGTENGPHITMEQIGQECDLECRQNSDVTLILTVILNQ